MFSVESRLPEPCNAVNDDNGNDDTDHTDDADDKDDEDDEMSDLGTEREPTPWMKIFASRPETNDKA